MKLVLHLCQKIIMKIILHSLYSLDTLFYLIFESIQALEVKDAVKFIGYAPESTNGNTKSCLDYPPNCIQSCVLNDVCTAIATHHETTRCDSIVLVFYGRVILKSNRNSTTWVKGLKFCTYIFICLIDLLRRENQMLNKIFM